MKTIRFEPNVPAEIRAIDRATAMTILEAIHLYAQTGQGRVKPLQGEFTGFLRPRAGNHRVFFEETEQVITIHRVRDRKDAYK